LTNYFNRTLTKRIFSTSKKARWVLIFIAKYILPSAALVKVKTIGAVKEKRTKRTPEKSSSFDLNFRRLLNPKIRKKSGVCKVRSRPSVYPSARPVILTAIRPF
jgi:hypothetical protein